MWPWSSFLCLCVFMCVHVCSCVFMCVHVCSCVFMCIHVCSCVFMCVLCVCMFMGLCVCMFSQVFFHVNSSWLCFSHVFYFFSCVVVSRFIFVVAVLLCSVICFCRGCVVVVSWLCCCCMVTHREMLHCRHWPIHHRWTPVVFQTPNEELYRKRW